MRLLLYLLLDCFEDLVMESSMGRFARKSWDELDANHGRITNISYVESYVLPYRFNGQPK